MTTLITDDHPNTLLDHQWISSDQAVEYLKTIKERTDNQLRDFSLLFNPTLSAGLVVKQYRYKILLVGKTGCGKTSLIRALMGKEFSTINAQPTLGIQTTNIYWPVRVNQPNKPIFMFRLDFWDVGHTSSTRFDYIDKDSVDSLDMILFVVSATDRESFNELPILIEQKRSQCSTSRPFISLVFVTKFDQLAVLTENDAKEFQAKYKIPVYLCSNTYSNMRLATSYLNLIAEKLYRRDLELIGQKNLPLNNILLRDFKRLGHLSRADRSSGDQIVQVAEAIQNLLDDREIDNFENEWILYSVEKSLGNQMKEAKFLIEEETNRLEGELKSGTLSKVHASKHLIVGGREKLTLATE
ncbi:unnamed protein product [Rotaria sordida]|uniref:Ciliogenesis and planar polarity effector 2 n=1 Tax=Rotaria sordida TaxID=392033 RepID=A0A818XTZ2_9BILA|nr:unnamed protein product [Rotaria sordida]CAF3741311.1 unnamed protein product [Rotaria sordida]